MKTTKLFLIAIFLISTFIIPNNSIAQVSKRIEIELLENSDHHIIPLENGTLLVLYKTETKKKVADVVFDLYDSNLEKINSTSTTLEESKEGLIDYVVSNDDVYILYAEAVSVTVMTYMKKIEIINYNTKLRTTKKFNTTLKEYLYFKEMFLKDGVVYLTGKSGLSARQIQQRSCFLSCGCMIFAPIYARNLYSQLKPVVHSFDFSKNVVAVKTNTYVKEKEKSEMLSASMNDSTGELNIISKTIISKKENKHTLHTFDGVNFQKEVNIKFPDGKEIIEARVESFGNSIIYGGTYLQKISKNKSVAVSSGVAVGLIKDGESQFNTLIPYTKFKNFSFNLNRNEERLVNKAKKKGEEEVGIEMMMKFHKTIEQDDKFIFMSEVYYPVYRYETVTTVDSRGVAHTTTRKVFDGFKYQGALVFAVSDKGEFLWENGVNVEDKNKYMSSNAYRYKFIEQNDGGVKILYNDGLTLFSGTVYDDKTVLIGTKIPLSDIKTEDKKAKITSSNSTSKSTTVSGNGVEYWFDNYFVSFGEQKITTKKENTLLGLAKDKKLIYFIDKVNVE